MSSKKSTHTQTADRRKEIVESALELFLERGYEETTIQDIVEASGASIGSIYHHFGSKEGIAGELYVSAFSDYHEVVLAALNSADSTEAAVKDVVEAHINWVFEHPDLARLMLFPRRADFIVASSERMEPLNEQFFGTLIKWLEDRSAKGELRQLSLDLYVSLWIGTAQDYARRWLRSGRKRVAPKDIAVLADAAWRALRVE